MPKMIRSKKRGTVSRKKVKKARLAWSYSDLYEDWLKLQTVRSSQTAAEVRVPTDTYEGWIQQRIRKRLSRA
jgi:hypothetical protein